MFKGSCFSSEVYVACCDNGTFVAIKGCNMVKYTGLAYLMFGAIRNSTVCREVPVHFNEHRHPKKRECTWYCTINN